MDCVLDDMKKCDATQKNACMNDERVNAEGKVRNNSP